MRVLLLCLGVLGLPEIARAASPAEIKSNVVIVRPRFVDKTRATFTRMAADYEALSERLLAMRGVDKRFTRAQLEQLAATIKGLANRFRLYAGSPGHGSGWIWMPNPQSKTAFVVTNEHVAGQAISVSIEFGRRSDHVPIEGEVVFVSRTTDLALIAIDRDELPASADGLELQTRGLAEGDTVYASGFPGTYTRRGLVPTYSLTNGIISNADFDTGADDGLTLTHTATIDPGNSGGPLLVRGRSGAFEVVGMNTAIGTQRRNLNYAIPGRLIGQDLTRATEAFRLRSSPQELDNALQKTAESLAIELGSASPNTELLSSLISYTYVSERPDMLTRPIEMGIKGELDERVFQLALQRPLEVARILLLDELRRNMGSTADNVGDVTFLEVTDPAAVASGGPVRSLFEVRGERREVTWIWEHGAWRIANVFIPRSAPRNDAASASEPRTAEASPPNDNEWQSSTEVNNAVASSSGGYRLLGQTLVITGVAATALGFLAGNRASSANDELNDGTVRSFSENDDLQSQADTFSLVGNIGVIGGLSLATLGAVLWATSGNQHPVPIAALPRPGGFEAAVRISW